MLTLLLVSFLLPAGQQASANAGTAMATRLQLLEDKAEIQQVLLDYGRALDSRDFVAYGKLFARDGEWVGGFGTATGGPAGIQAFMEKSMGTAPNTAKNYHVLTNFVITVTGDTATAWSRWQFVVPGATGGASISQAGRYDDMLVRENGHWRIKRRTASNDTGTGARAGGAAPAK